MDETLIEFYSEEATEIEKVLMAAVHHKASREQPLPCITDKSPNARGLHENKKTQNKPRIQ